MAGLLLTFVLIVALAACVYCETGNIWGSVWIDFYPDCNRAPATETLQERVTVVLSQNAVDIAERIVGDGDGYNFLFEDLQPGSYDLRVVDYDGAEPTSLVSHKDGICEILPSSQSVNPTNFYSRSGVLNNVPVRANHRTKVYFPIDPCTVFTTTSSDGDGDGDGDEPTVCECSYHITNNNVGSNENLYYCEDNNDNCCITAPASECRCIPCVIDDVFYGFDDLYTGNNNMQRSVAGEVKDSATREVKGASTHSINGINPSGNCCGDSCQTLNSYQDMYYCCNTAPDMGSCTSRSVDYYQHAYCDICGSYGRDSQFPGAPYNVASTFLIIDSYYCPP